MSETLTSTDAPADQPELNADEQESLAIAEANESEQQQLLAGKFDNAQSLEQAYLELQKKLGESREEEPEDDEPGEESDEEYDDSAENDSDEPDGQLTEDQAEQLHEMVGGEKAYQSMLEWAGQNFSQEEIDMYDSVMDSGNANSIYFAVQALANTYFDNVGSEGQLLTGRGASESNAIFRSQSELVQAMNDPRYDNDPAYRSDVMTKLENSDLGF